MSSENESKNEVTGFDPKVRAAERDLKRPVRPLVVMTVILALYLQQTGQALCTDHLCHPPDWVRLAIVSPSSMWRGRFAVAWRGMEWAEV